MITLLCFFPPITPIPLIHPLPKYIPLSLFVCSFIPCNHLALTMCTLVLGYPLTDAWTTSNNHTCKEKWLSLSQQPSIINSSSAHELSPKHTGVLLAWSSKGLELETTPTVSSYVHELHVCVQKTAFHGTLPQSPALQLMLEFYI